VIAAATDGNTAGSGYEITKQFMNSTGGANLPRHFLSKNLRRPSSPTIRHGRRIFSPSLSIGAGIGTTLRL